MNEFGKRLFSSSRFIFWSLTPFLILFAMAMPFLVIKWTAATVILMIALEATASLLVLGLWNPYRFRWALRCVTAVVFGLCLTAIIDELFLSGNSFTFSNVVSGKAPVGNIKGILFIGISCLLFTLFGKFFSIREKIKDRFKKRLRVK